MLKRLLTCAPVPRAFGTFDARADAEYNGIGVLVTFSMLVIFFVATTPFGRVYWEVFSS